MYIYKQKMNLPESLAATKQLQNCHRKGEWGVWKEKRSEMLGEGRRSQPHKKPFYTILSLSASINKLELTKFPPLQLPKLQDSLNKSWLKFSNLKHTTERPLRAVLIHF